eukprot:g3649.t1
MAALSEGERTSAAAQLVGYDVVVCLDFEATCDEGDAPKVSREEQEIIEFPWVVFDLHELSVTSSRQIYIRPENTDVTEFCTGLTGITAEDVKDGCTLEDALAQFHESVIVPLMEEEKKFCLITHGNWDLIVQLRSEAHRKGIHLDDYLLSYLDLRDIFRWWCTISHRPCGSTSLTAMTEALGIQLQGRLHSGIDDASTMAAVLQRIISMTVGSGSSANIVGFPSALNWKTMVDSFAAQRGVHLRVDSMPFKASETDVLDWLLRMGAKNAPLEMARGIDKTRLRPTGSAYIQFDAHEDAKKVMTETVRELHGRASCVLACDRKEFEQAVVLPFPADDEKFRDSDDGWIVRVANLPYVISQQEVAEWFQRLGVEMAKSIECFSSVSAHRPSGVAFFSFSKHDDAAKFMSLCAQEDAPRLKGRLCTTERSSKAERDGASNIGQLFPLPTMQELEIPMHSVGAVVGKRGWRIQQIEKDSCTRITTPRRGQAPIFRVYGELSAVQMALDMIQQVVSEQLIARSTATFRPSSSSFSSTST